MLIKRASWAWLHLAALVSAATTAPSAPSCTHWHPGNRPVHLILVGDSTTAAAGSQACAGGCGGALLAHLNENAGATGVNLGVCSMTTKTYSTYQHWQKALDEIKGSVKSHATVVFISFGINDEHAGMPMSKFSVNLVAYQREVSRLGALPIFVTPLDKTSCTPGFISFFAPSYSASTKTMIDVGAKTRTCVLDLNKGSWWQYNIAGCQKTVRYRRTLKDFVHLNKLVQK